ncbi:unnamed protein product, partial [Rotaria sp. Silwood2]
MGTDEICVNRQTSSGSSWQGGLCMNHREA